MNRWNLAASGLLAVLLGTPALVQAAPCSVAQLEWLQGIWRADAAGGRTEEERWTGAPGEVLLGSAWTVAKGKAVFGEIMTIEAGADGLDMRLRHFSDSLGRDWEGHDPPMLFHLSDCQDRLMMLEGQGKNAGEKLTYRRLDDKRLLIIGDFLHQGKPDHEEFQLTRVEH